MAELVTFEPTDLLEADRSVSFGLADVDDATDPAVLALFTEVSDATVAAGLGPLGWAGDDEVVDALAALERDSRALAARELRLVALLMERLTAGGWVAPGGLGLSWGEAGVSEFAADEIATVLGVSRRVAELRMQDAFTLVHRLPSALAAMEAGLITLQVARVLAVETANTDEGLAAEVSACVLDALGRGVKHRLGRMGADELRAWAAAHPGKAGTVAADATGPRVRVLARRALSALDSDAVRVARDKAVAARDVEIWRGRPGMAWVGAQVPEARAGAVYDRVNSAALDASRRPGEDRTLGQIRADLFVDWLLGAPAGEAGPPVNLHLTIPASGPPELERLGTVDPTVVAELLALAVRTGGGATVTRIAPVTCPGRHLSAGSYKPSSRLAAAVRARDVTCRFPGCSAPARVCDLDHTVPHPEGPTCACNLACLCRHHHRLKTLGLWTVINHGDGHLTWRSPHARTYDVWPDGP